MQFAHFPSFGLTVVFLVKFYNLSERNALAKPVMRENTLMQDSTSSAEFVVNYPLHFSDNQAGIMTAKAERIAHCNIDLFPTCLQGHIVHLQVAAFIGVIEVDGGGEN